MQRLFLFDFDHTLFDTDALVKSISVQLTPILKTPQLIDEFWKTLRSLHHQPFYIQAGIKQFCENHQIIEQRENLYNAFLSQPFSSMIYADVLTALSYVSTGGELGIFTTGDSLYQQVKVQQSGIGEKMQFIYIFDNKMDHFAEVVDKHPQTEIWYVDNQLLLLEKATQINNTIKTAWMKRSDYPKETQFQPTVTVIDMFEFVKFIKENNE